MAIEALLLRHGHTGVERFILNLLRNLPALGKGYRFTVFLWGACSVELPPESEAITYVRCRAKSKLARALFLHLVLPFRARDHSHVLFTGYLGSFFVPGKKSALWVYDLIALRRRSPASLHTRLHHRLFLPYFLRIVQTVFCPSRAVHDEIRSRRGNRGGVLIRRLPVEECFYEPSPPRESPGFRPAIS